MTGDAVVLDVQIAQLPVRALSALIDVAVIFIGYLIGVMLWAATLSSVRPRTERRGADHLHRAGVGGLSARVRDRDARQVVGQDGARAAGGVRRRRPERFRQALFRALAGVVEIWMFFGGPAVICSLLSPKGKRLGDVFAGTVVISERAPRMSTPPTMPPALAWWASSLQLSALGPEQAELARQFLARASQLDPRVRDQMAYRIAAEVVSRISPPPPPGTPPQYVLAAVLAERHRRELARLRTPAPVAAPPPQWPAPSAYQQPPPPTSHDGRGFTPPS